MALVGCRQQPANQQAASWLLAPLSGTITIAGVKAPVIIVRDRWGVPHIKAESQSDLFFAQGFVQAQDRLFQMDLWRRSASGRLSEVLGPNFIERDAMTRRVQYRGDLEAEWASYGPDTKAIAAAFVQGINAYIRLMGQRVPEAFRLAGWTPDLWRVEDLLSRTDAFLASGDAFDEVFRAQLVVAIGAARASAILPGRGPLTVPRGLDLKTVSPVIADILRRAGTPPFFLGFAAPLQVDLGAGGAGGGGGAGGASNAWVVAQSDRGSPLVAGDPHTPLETPSLRYLIHLEAPGWNVIGATSPWLPGVAIGHNDRVAWAMTASNADTEDIYVERLNPANPHQIADRGGWVDMTVEKESVRVKGRESYDYERLYTPHGAVIALDSERHLAFTLQWSGFQAGGAAELASLALDRAHSPAEFEAALDRWKMPAAEFVFAGADGRIGRRVAALTPIRTGGNGALPAPADPPEYEWRGFAASKSDQPAAFLASANGSRARLGRITDVLAEPAARSLDGFKRLQQDVLAWNAERLVPLLEELRAERPDTEQERRALLRWDRRAAAASREAALYVAWERLLLRNLAALRVPPNLVDGYLTRSASVLVPALVDPSSVWFDGNGARARDALLLRSLADAVEERSRAGIQERPWGSLHAVTFVHPLGITDAARRRFNVGPIEIGGYAETVLATPVVRSDRAVAPSLRTIFDAGDWDRSVAINAPGQAESPSSPHFSDLATLWSAGEYFPLAFSAEAVQQNAESTLVLAPRN